jgi:copper chaperone CopZ
VSGVNVDHENTTVEVTFDSGKIALKRILQVLYDIDYPVEGRPEFIE